MNTYPVPEGLAPQYHGAGHALAAITGGALVRILYLHDILPEYDGAMGLAALRKAIDLPTLAPVVREFQALGEVSAGILSCWEFIEL
jgi:hypothetical protein